MSCELLHFMPQPKSISSILHKPKIHPQKTQSERSQNSSQSGSETIRRGPDTTVQMARIGRIGTRAPLPFPSRICSASTLSTACFRKRAREWGAVSGWYILGGGSQAVCVDGTVRVFSETEQGPFSLDEV